MAVAGRVAIVPKGDWSRDTLYEKLDAVYYLGSSYVAKKSSVNILPTDTEYWMLMVTGTSDEQINQLIEDINALFDEVDSVKADIANLDAEVEATKKSVSDGKTLVANAITEKGVETATDATFEVMAENILAIEGSGGQLINYAMLYDAGDECVDITNSWDRSCGNASINAGNFGQLTKNSDSFSGSINDTSATANYLYYRCTTNAIDLTEYSTLGLACRNLVASGTYGLEICWWDESPVFWSGTRNPSQSVLNGKVGTLDVGSVDGNKYITVSIATSYDKTASITADISGVFMVKADSWGTWIEKAGLSLSDYASLDAVMADTEALSTLMNNMDAVNYMLKKCTGTVMASVIQSSNALSAIINSPYFEEIYANEHWNKFLEMVGVNYDDGKLYLYDSGNECTAVTGGWVQKSLYWDNTEIPLAQNTLIKNVDNMTLTRNANGDSSYKNLNVFTVNPIGTSKYSTLNILYDCSTASVQYTNYVIFGDANTQSGVIGGEQWNQNTYLADRGGGITKTDAIVSLSLDGDDVGYVGVLACVQKGINTITIKKIWLE